MRFLCTCVTTLSYLLAVRCTEFMPKPMIASTNILRGVLASDREWSAILSVVMKPEALNLNGMLTNMGITVEPEKGIMPYQIVQWLVTHKGATGSQIMYGIQVLGLALENQFAKTLMAHLLLIIKFSTNIDTTPASVRHCISSIQLSLVVFANKVAFFGHPIIFFWELNDLINEFLATNKIFLDNEDEMLTNTRSVIDRFLELFLSTIANKVASNELNMEDEEILKILDLSDDSSLINSHQQYSIINNIDYYEQVNVSSFGLDFGKKMFKIISYSEKKTD